MKSKVYIIIAATAAAAVAGCNTSGCLDNGSSLPLAGFYNSDGEQVSLDSLTISGIGAPNDSVLVAPGTKVDQVYLPLRSTASTTSYVLHYTYQGLDSVIYNDTLRFDYTSIPYFASEECGAMYQYHIDRMDYTTNLIERIEITDSLITNADIQRLKIYMRQ